MVSEETGAYSPFCRADFTKQSEMRSQRSRKIFLLLNAVEYHMPQEHRKVVKDLGVTSANGYLNG